MPQRTSLILLAATAISTALLGCTAPERRIDSETPALPPPREGVLLFHGDGAPTTWPEMVRTLSTADIVIIGESHGQPRGLAAAAALWDDLLAQRPSAVLAMEFFERDQQVALDDYLHAVTDEQQFREAARRSDSSYPDGHRAMVESARAAGRPVVAANAPRRYVRMTTPDGYERLAELGAEQRRLFALPDRPIEGRYRDDFFTLMSGGGHGEQMPADMVEKFFYSQQMWDATMADSVVRAAGRGELPVVLVVGRFHADFGGATVEFVRRSRPDLTIRTVSVVETDAPALEEEDIGRADFVWYAPPAGPSPASLASSHAQGTRN